jgi:2-phospho-L-lactate/phosphoenolpyruvate guanylyltransferase
VNTVALVPINTLTAAKSRLSVSVGAEERQALVLWMASRVLAAVRRSGAVTSVAVVSPDPMVLRWSEGQGAVAVHQVSGDLNDGLEVGRRWAIAHGAEALLVLLADLPCLTPRDVRALVDAAASTPASTPTSTVASVPAGVQSAVVLAPDRARRGTNGLLIRPATLLPFAFGQDSLERHTGLARERGLEPLLRRTLGTCFDVDTPSDLEELGWRRMAAEHEHDAATTHARGESA